MSTLLITAKPSGGLTYSDNDVVQVLDGLQNPGSAVTPTATGFLFCYISDKDYNDPEVMALMQPWEEGSDDSDLPPVQLAKRRYQVTLTGSEFETWVPAQQADAAGIEKTWAEIQAITTDRGDD